MRTLDKPKLTPSSAVHATERGPSIRRQLTDQQLCLLTFDRPGSSANVFDRETLEELEQHVTFLEQAKGLKGVVLASAKPSIFVAGADLHSLVRLRDPERLRELIRLGQSVFDRLARLDLPKVAAIHGACLGGGYELTLACDYRLASTDRSTKIGLPETMLGILPAWGGATRLPRLIGLPAALELVLAGKVVPAKVALKRGLVDQLCPAEYVVELAQRKVLSEGGRLRKQRRSVAFWNNPLMARMVAWRAGQQTRLKTRGHYPAIPKALEVMVRGLRLTVAGSMALEVEALLELAATSECRSLMNVFLMQERARKRGVQSATSRPIAHTAVIGAGIMGAGIAQWFSARGLPVILQDVNAQAVALGLSRIRDLYRQGVRRHRFTRLEAESGLDRVSPTAQEVPLGNVDLVVEAAVEKMEVKKQIFAALERRAGPKTILATNTSALSITQLASGLRQPERIIGVHFFNPVHRMQLVEVVLGERTSPEVVDAVVRFVQRIGKLPVVVKDSPGFLVNRVLVPYMIEAGVLFEQGARVEDIDEAILSFGMPMGPLRLIDEVGADVAAHVAGTLAEHFGDRMRVPGVLQGLMRENWCGRKAGCGFYSYQGKRVEVNPRIDRFRVGQSAVALSRGELQLRMVSLMVNEGARCLEEGIVQEPGDVDFGMIMGTGFAPFRGGPLRYADTTGLRLVVEHLERLTQEHGARFRPCELLRRMAKSNEKFYKEERNEHDSYTR